MAITINTQPTEDSFVAAAAPVWFQAETSLTQEEIVITGVADNSGSVQLSFGSAPGHAPNMVLLISGATGDYAYLNGRHDVVSSSGSDTVIDLAYQAATTGSDGTATLLLEKWSMGVENQYVIDGNDYDIGIHYVPWQTNEAFKDVSRIICGLFQSVFSLTAGWTSELNKGIFYIKTAIFEAALKADYTRSVIDSEVVQWYAVKSAMLTGRILATGSQNKLLNGTTNYKVHAGTKVIMSMVTTDSVVSAYYSYNIGATNTNNTVAFTTDNYKGNYVFTPVAGSTGIQLYIRDSGGARISEILTVTLLGGAGCNVYPLYWLNHYGGYDMYEFVEQNETNATGNRLELRGSETAMGNLIDKDYSTESWHEVKLIGRNETETDLAYLRDLFTSPEIFNASGERVKLLTTNFVTRSRENITPEITVLVNRGATIW